MAEALALTASIIAVVQLTERVASICKFFIEKIEDYPRDLRLIYVEIGSLKVIFEGLSFLERDDPANWTTFKALQGDNGPVNRCKNALEELATLFPALTSLPGLENKRGEKMKAKAALVMRCLAWPFKESKAKALLDEIMQYKSTIGVALQGQLLWVPRVSIGGVFITKYSKHRHTKYEASS